METIEVAPQDHETVEPAAETVETLTQEQIADLKKKADVSSQNFERAKKAEAELKEAREKLKETVPSKQVEGLSTPDILALSKANLADEDVEEVLDYAKFKKISVKEALSTPVLKNILGVKDQDRKNAAAINTSAARGTPKVSEQDYLAKAQNGEIIDSEEGMAAIFKARTAQKLGKKR